MSSSNPRSWLDGLLGLCLTLLLAAIAVHVAVRLIEAVWPALVLILGIGALLAAGVALLRRGDRGW